MAPSLTDVFCHSYFGRAIDPFPFNELNIISKGLRPSKCGNHIYGGDSVSENDTTLVGVPIQGTILGAVD